MVRNGPVSWGSIPKCYHSPENEQIRPLKKGPCSKGNFLRNLGHVSFFGGSLIDIWSNYCQAWDCFAICWSFHFPKNIQHACLGTCGRESWHSVNLVFQKSKCSIPLVLQFVWHVGTKSVFFVWRLDGSIFGLPAISGPPGLEVWRYLQNIFEQWKKTGRSGYIAHRPKYIYHESQPFM